MRNRIHNAAKQAFAQASVALGVVGLLAGCSLPVAPGGTPANAVGSFGVLGEIPHLHLDPVPVKAPRFASRIIAHRGYSSQYPENTVSAIRAAVEAAENTAPPAPETIFEDVFSENPWHLEEQREELLTHLEGLKSKENH